MYRQRTDCRRKRLRSRSETCSACGRRTSPASRSVLDRVLLPSPAIEDAPRCTSPSTALILVKMVPASPLILGGMRATDLTILRCKQIQLLPLKRNRKPSRLLRRDRVLSKNMLPRPDLAVGRRGFLEFTQLCSSYALMVRISVNKKIWCIDYPYEAQM